MSDKSQQHALALGKQSSSVTGQLITRGPATDLEIRLRKRGLDNKTSKYDNFYTPQNDFFYDNSPYLPLNSKRREFRLLRVFPPKSYGEHIKANPSGRLPTKLTACRYSLIPPLFRL